MDSASQIPDWLSAARSVAYLTFLLKTLAEREAIRSNARSIARRQVSSPNSQTPFHPMPLGPAKEPKLKGLPAHYSVCVGCQPGNVLHNRYYQLEPYDRTRVIVAGGQGTEGRYLNASWVLEQSGSKWWIATQAPLPSTAHAFLSLLLQPTVRPSPELLQAQNSPAQLPPQGRIRTVVQLTQELEGGRRKAHAYFPSEVGKSLVITPEESCVSPALKVTLLNMSSIDEAHCIQSTVSVVPINLYESSSLVQCSGSEEEVDDDEGNYGEEISSQRVTFQHMLYTSWPDHEIPTREDRASLISFIRLVDKVNRDTSIVSHTEGTEIDPDPTIMVGCSAGIGRTGSFIAISSLLRFLGQLPPASSPTLTSVLPPSPLGPLHASLANDPVVQEVDSLREQRPGMVQRDEQVVFIYEALAIALGAI